MFNKYMSFMSSFYSPESFTSMWDLWLDNLKWNKQKTDEITKKYMEQSQKVMQESSKNSELLIKQLIKSQSSMQAMSREFINSTNGYINHQLEKKISKPAE